MISLRKMCQLILTISGQNFLLLSAPHLLHFLVAFLFSSRYTCILFSFEFTFRILITLAIMYNTLTIIVIENINTTVNVLLAIIIIIKKTASITFNTIPQSLKFRFFLIPNMPLASGMPANMQSRIELLKSKSNVNIKSIKNMPTMLPSTILIIDITLV